MHIPLHNAYTLVLRVIYHKYIYEHTRMDTYLNHSYVCLHTFKSIHINLPTKITGIPYVTKNVKLQLPRKLNPHKI